MIGTLALGRIIDRIGFTRVLITTFMLAIVTIAAIGSDRQDMPVNAPYGSKGGPSIGEYDRLYRVEEAPLRSAHNRPPFVEGEVDMETLNSSSTRRAPWNKGRLNGQRPPLKLGEIWAIRTRLQMSSLAGQKGAFVRRVTRTFEWRLRLIKRPIDCRR